MSTEARFDTEIMKQVQAQTAELIKHKEIRSVLVVIDWNLATGKGLPLGVWQLGPEAHSIAAAAHMIRQVAEMTHNMTKATADKLTHIINDVDHKLAELKKGTPNDTPNTHQ